MAIPTSSSSDEEVGGSRRGRGKRAVVTKRRGIEGSLESALGVGRTSRLADVRAETIRPYLRTTRKALLQKFRNLGHVNAVDEVKVYKYEANVEQSIEIKVPVSELEAASATFCFLGHFSTFSTVPTQEAEGHFVWRLDSRTLCTIEFDRAQNDGFMTIYFGIFGWKPTSEGAAIVRPDPDGLHIPAALAPPPPPPAQYCPFCAGGLRNHKTNRCRILYGYTGPDFCNKCAQILKRHHSKGYTRTDASAHGSCTADNRCGTVRAAPGPLSAISVCLLQSVFYGAFVWAHRALNRPKRRFPARAVLGDRRAHTAQA